MNLIRPASIFVSALLTLATGWAQSFRAEGPMVLVNEYPVVLLKATLDGRNPSNRARSIVETLKSKGIKAPITTRVTPTGTWIMSGSTQIVRVTTSEAAAHKTAVSDLIRQWKARIEFALKVPPVQVNRAHVLSSVRETKFLRVFGTEALKFEIENSSPEIMTVEKAEGGVKISFLKGGSAEVWLRSPGGSARITARIQPSALQDLSQLNGDVIGNPPSLEAIRQAASAVIRSQLPSAPDATVEILKIDAVRPVPGAAVRSTAQIRVRAPGTAPYEGPIQIRLNPIPFITKRESELWYSNVPESVKQLGTLFSGELRVGSPVRMLYHHLNDFSTPITIQVVAYNPTQYPARVLMTRGEGEPSTNPVKAGLEAGERYLKAWTRSEGIVLNIPPMSRVPLSLRALDPQVTLSGLSSLNLLSGEADRIIVQTQSLRVTDVEPLWRISPSSSVIAPPRPFVAAALPTNASPSDHIYRDPFRDLEAGYRVGGRFTFVRIGQVPINSVDLQRQLQGNFGVVYNLTAELENPTQKVEHADVVFEASAGYSGGVFMVDGVIQPSTILQSKGELLLKRVRLAPGERRVMKVTTIPLSGSSYPATIVIRPQSHSN